MIGCNLSTGIKIGCFQKELVSAATRKESASLGCFAQNLLVSPLPNQSVCKLPTCKTYKKGRLSSWFSPARLWTVVFRTAHVVDQFGLARKPHVAFLAPVPAKLPSGNYPSILSQKKQLRKKLKTCQGFHWWNMNKQILPMFCFTKVWIKEVIGKFTHAFSPIQASQLFSMSPHQCPQQPRKMMTSMSKYQTLYHKVTQNKVV